jgi:hypothetical protein
MNTFSVQIKTKNKQCDTFSEVSFMIHSQSRIQYNDFCIYNYVRLSALGQIKHLKQHRSNNSKGLFEIRA